MRKRYKNPHMGEIFKTARTKHGFTIQQVSDMIFERIGIRIKEKTIYGWENGVSAPNSGTFLEVCRIYELNDLSIFYEEPLMPYSFDEKDLWVVKQYNESPYKKSIDKLLDMPKFNS